LKNFGGFDLKMGTTFPPTAAMSSDLYCFAISSIKFLSARASSSIN
jgi:hypothetical protein